RLSGERHHFTIGILTLDGFHAIRAASKSKPLTILQYLASQKCRFPVKTHAHTHTSKHKELWLTGFQTQGIS
ncbi:hypothetical protein ACSFB1_12365, partial [Glaesserella parasuis]|uniref:hypothetical protein n=1 Tax=Glaesserella parasuis TaxID=738 RepID=UPI003F40BEEA